MKQSSIFSLLALSTVSSFLIATASVLVLEPQDRISISRGGCLTLLGLVFFLSLFYFINHLALKTAPGFKLRKKYQLTVGDVLDISNKLVSAVQAALSCVTGGVVCLWSCTRDFLHSSHFMSEAYAWFGAAYFFYDIWSMYKVHIHMSTAHPAKYFTEKAFNKAAAGNNLDVPGNGAFLNVDHKRKNKIIDALSGDIGSETKVNMDSQSVSFLAYCKDQPVIIMHHLFIGGFGFLVIVYLRGGLGDCVFGFVYLMEASTPFVSIRGILSKMKLKSTQTYVWNGIIMVVTFFLCRILTMPILLFWYSKVIGLPFWEATRSLPTGCQISILILLLPQVYWFYLMVLGAYKVFFPANAIKTAVHSSDSDNNLASKQTQTQKNVSQAKQLTLTTNGANQLESS